MVRRFRRTPAAAPVAARAMAGIAPGDHVCVRFGSDDEHQGIVGRYASQALHCGDRLLYFAHLSDEWTIRAYLDEAGIDAAAGLALGQIQIRPIEHSSDSFDPEALAANLRTDRRAALDDGYRALACLTEMSWMLDRPADLELANQYEHDVDGVIAAGNIASLCQYDRRMFPEEFLTRLIAAHNVQVCTSGSETTTARGRLTISEHDDETVALSGALDIDSAAYAGVRLAAHDGDGDLVVRTAELGFADISGCRAIVHAAELLDDGRRLVLPEPAPALVRVMGMCGWTDHPQLVFGSPVHR